MKLLYKILLCNLCFFYLHAQNYVDRSGDWLLFKISDGLTIVTKFKHSTNKQQQALYHFNELIIKQKSEVLKSLIVNDENDVVYKDFLNIISNDHVHSFVSLYASKSNLLIVDLWLMPQWQDMIDTQKVEDYKTKKFRFEFKIEQNAFVVKILDKSLKSDVYQKMNILIGIYQLYLNLIQNLI